METVRQQYQDQMPIELLVGGLRPGNTERFDEHRRDYVLAHWRAVHQRTKQLFNFEFQMDPDFTYDTEPASRAVVVVRTLNPTKVFPYFRAIQHAFYVEKHDVTKEGVLKNLAETHGIAPSLFSESFHNSEMRRKVWQEFDRCRQLGISGFPSLLAMDEDTPTVLAHGYLPKEELIPNIDEWLKK